MFADRYYRSASIDGAGSDDRESLAPSSLLTTTDPSHSGCKKILTRMLLFVAYFLIAKHITSSNKSGEETQSFSSPD